MERDRELGTIGGWSRFLAEKSYEFATFGTTILAFSFFLEAVSHPAAVAFAIGMAIGLVKAALTAMPSIK